MFLDIYTLSCSVYLKQKNPRFLSNDEVESITTEGRKKKKAGNVGWDLKFHAILLM